MKAVELLKKPAIDMSKGGAGFPLQTTSIPLSADDLAAALKSGYAERLMSPDRVLVDAAAGAKPGLLKHLIIDISGSAVRPDFVPKGAPKENEPVAFLHAGQMAYIADPLNYQHFTASMRLDAKNAQMAIMPAGDGTFGLSLYDCKTAHASLRLSMDGLRESMAKGVAVKQSLAFMVDSVDLAMASDNPRSVEVDVTVHSRLFLIPANFHLIGRADIDDDFYIHFSKLNAAGLDTMGKVVAGVVQSRLDKVNNKAAPLLKLPGDRIRLSDVKMYVGDSLTIDADLKGGNSPAMSENDPATAE